MCHTHGLNGKIMPSQQKEIISHSRPEEEPENGFFKGLHGLGFCPTTFSFLKKVAQAHYYMEWALKPILSCFMSWVQKPKLSHPINWAWCPWTLFLLKPCTPVDGLTRPSTLAPQIGSKSPNLVTTWIKFGSP